MKWLGDDIWKRNIQHLCIDPVSVHPTSQHFLKYVDNFLNIFWFEYKIKVKYAAELECFDGFVDFGGLI